MLNTIVPIDSGRFLNIAADIYFVCFLEGKVVPN